MAFVKVEDIYGQIEVICFPKVYDNARDVINNEEIVKVVGKLQIKDGVPQIIAESIERFEIKEQTVIDKEQEYMGLILPDEMEDCVDDVLDVLSGYEGNIPVIIALKGKKYNAHCSVRRCEGLISELKNFVAEEDIIFFKRKS